VVGIDNLGRALVNSTNSSFAARSSPRSMTATPRWVGSSVAGYVVKSLEDPMFRTSRSLRAAGGGPQGRRSAGQRGNPRAAQLRTASHQRADRYRRALRGLLDRVQILMYHLNNGTGPLGGGLLHSLGILTPAPMRGA